MQVGESALELVEGDITTQDTVAIVNAANRSLLGGGGVDGAIHRAAGPGLLAECATLGGCETGQAKITGGHRLRARYVIHTVGPVYGRQPALAARPAEGRAGRPGGGHAAELLASCYRECLDLAERHGISSIAFPAISTGAYGYPMDEAARVALTTVIDVLPTLQVVRLVRFVLYNQAAFRAYENELRRLTAV